MNALDFILLTLLAITLIRGLMRGMIRQVASLAAIVAGFIVAGHLYLRLLPLFRSYLPFIPYPEVVSYTAVFIATWLAVILLGTLVLRLSRVMLMGWADRLFGGALGLLKGGVAGVILVAVLTVFLPDGSKILTRSMLAPHALRAGSYLVQLTPENVQSKYQKKKQSILRHLMRKHRTQKTTTAEPEHRLPRRGSHG